MPKPMSLGEHHRSLPVLETEPADRDHSLNVSLGQVPSLSFPATFDLDHHLVRTRLLEITARSKEEADVNRTSIDWEAYCTLHRADDGGGLLDATKSIRHGALADLVKHVMSLPEEKRMELVIEKAGDHRLSYGEVAALARRDDFPVN